MDNLYRSLWYADNPYVSKLFEAYLSVLSWKFSEFAKTADPGGLFSKISNSWRSGEFLSVPDVAASLWKCSRNPEKSDVAYLAKSAKEFLDTGKVSTGGFAIPRTEIVLTPEDGNPYGVYDAHPDNRKDGVWRGWGGASPETWLAAYADAFEILRVSSPGFHAEMGRFLKKVVPLWTDDRAHRSCSYAEAFWCAYAGLIPSEDRPGLSVLEALIHEWSHNKANLARNLVPLIGNGPEGAYYSSFRPDPRPIEWIFLGIHAFAPTVSVFLNAFETVLDPSSRIGKVYGMHLKNELAAEVLGKYLVPTPEGAKFLSETLAVHSSNRMRLEAFRGKFAEKFAQAERTRDEHVRKSLETYPGILR